MYIKKTLLTIFNNRHEYYQEFVNFIFPIISLISCMLFLCLIVTPGLHEVGLSISSLDIYELMCLIPPLIFLFIMTLILLTFIMSKMVTKFEYMLIVIYILVCFIVVNIIFISVVLFLDIFIRIFNNKFKKELGI